MSTAKSAGELFADIAPIASLNVGILLNSQVPMFFHPYLFPDEFFLSGSDDKLLHYKLIDFVTYCRIH